MNVRWTVSLSACAAVLLFAGVLATAAEPAIGQGQSATPGSAGIIRISTLMGTTVLNPQSQKLGGIKDVLLDSKTGQTTFVVLDAEVPASGHAMLVVPYQALQVSLTADNHQSVTLDLRPDQLRAAPQIQNNQWQMLQNRQFLEQARNFYQAKTYTAARPIDNPSTPGPPIPVVCPPIPCFVPQPCMGYMNSGWTHELDEFSEE